MDTTTKTHSRRLGRTAALLAALSALGLSMTLLAAPVLASRTVVPISEGNPTCADFAGSYGGGASWTEFKLEGEDLDNGTYSDGTLEVTISNFVNSSSGTPGSFDWSSNIGIDAVFVKAGNDKHNLYLYDPEATSDTGLGPQAGAGNGISHISFCYDVEEETPSPTPTPTATPTEVPTPTPTPEESVQESTSTPTPTPEQSVEAGTGTPAPSLPDGAMGAASGPSPLPTVFFGLILLASLATLAWVNVKAVHSRA